MINQFNTVNISGPVGILETIILESHDSIQGISIINHPNPLYGGSNTNKVVHTIAKALRKKGYICLLPNLRGVGNSAGQHDYGKGEVDDVLAVIEYAKTKYPEDIPLILAGFSFGGYISTKVAQEVFLEKLILVGAAVDKYVEPAPFVPNVNHTLFIQGADDDVIPLSSVLAWSEPQQLPVIVIPGAGHFFHGKLIVLEQVISRFLW